MKKKNKKTGVFKMELCPGVVPTDGNARTHNAMLVDYKLRIEPHQLRV